MDDLLTQLANNWSNIAITLATVLLAILAYLGFRDARRGPDVWLVTDDLVEPETIVDIEDTSQYYRERIFLTNRLTFVNYGPRSGAITSLATKLSSSLPSYVGIDSSYFYGPSPNQTYSPDSVPLSVEGNGTVGLVNNLTVAVKEKGKPLLRALKDHPEFTVTYSYTVVVSKGKTKQRTNTVRVRPRGLREVVRTG